MDEIQKAHETPEETVREIQKIDIEMEMQKMKAELKDVREKMRLVYGDEELLRYYQMRELRIMDYISGMNFAWEEGFKEGLKEAREEREAEELKEWKQQVVRNMKAAGFSVKQIMRLSGFSLKEIEELQESGQF